jgi:hypothetical protein
MDLKSLKEKKAMLSETSLVENLLHKPPFEIRIQDLKQTVQSNLDRLSAICKTVKPHSVESCTISSVRSAEVDMEYLKLSKSRQIHKAEEEIQDLKAKMILVPSLHSESSTLLQELEIKNRQFENEGEIVDDSRGAEAKIDDESYAIYAQDSVTLLEDFNEVRKLQFENSALKQRLKSIPVQPGFDFSKENLQNVLEQKLLQLEDLKRQVFEDSMIE